GNRLASRIGTATPRMANILDALRSRGYAAGRAHTNPVGIKTDAPLKELETVFRDLEKGG
ncbi:MAG: tRNA (guanine(10)-N(2))-dimethyltransferase, partial [Thermoplasmata archaeon]|nr:tRNA (guanine(10)-N(2))-dimethyltransferase [Thermoplasmata archaeon]